MRRLFGIADEYITNRARSTTKYRRVAILLFMGSTLIWDAGETTRAYGGMVIRAKPYHEACGGLIAMQTDETVERVIRGMEKVGGQITYLRRWA